MFDQNKAAGGFVITGGLVQVGNGGSAGTRRPEVLSSSKA
jgi:hypothetical protein